MVEYAGISLEEGSYSRDSNGNYSASRVFLFELSGEDRYQKDRVRGRPEIPAKGTPYDGENSGLLATGAFNLSMEDDGSLVKVECFYELPSNTSGFDANGKTVDANTPPWDLLPSTITILDDVITVAVKKDAFGKPIQSTSGTDLIMTKDEAFSVFEFTYSLKTFNPNWTYLYKNRINLKEEQVCGMTFKPKCCRIDKLRGTHKLTRDEKGKIKWSYWDIDVRMTFDSRVAIEIDKSGKEIATPMAWRKEVANMSTYMKNPKGGMLPIYAYTPPGEPTDFDSLEVLEKAYPEAKKADKIERVTEPIWLDEKGRPALYGEDDTQVKMYLMFDLYYPVNWSPLSFPKDLAGGWEKWG